MKAVTAKKRLGQHFLIDLSIAKDIADTVDTCPGMPILEVGPGMGVLTRFLIEKERPLKVVEIDEESVSYLCKNLPQLQEENIIPDDFLKIHRQIGLDGQNLRKPQLTDHFSQLIILIDAAFFLRKHQKHPFKFVFLQYSKIP